MNKVGLKLIIVLVVVSVLYSLLWFFKVGQVEKQVSNFISENSAHITSGEITSSGFPFKQKVTIKDLKFTIPNQVLNKRQILIKKLELVAGIFSSDFSATISELPVTLQDADNNIATLEFGKEPEIQISFVNDTVTKFIYNDAGYRVLDADKNLIYGASATNVTLTSETDSENKIHTKIQITAKDIEGFKIVDIYSNAFEKTIIEGIKTGEIILGNNAPPAPDLASLVASTTETKKPAEKTISEIKKEEAAPVVAVQPQTEEVTNIIENNNLAKNNFFIDFEYILTPNQPEQKLAIPTEPSQIQEQSLQYNKMVKINNFEFSNPLYKLTINGEFNIFPDDTLPSGTIVAKVEKIDDLLSYISAYLKKVADQKGIASSSTSAPQIADLTSAGVPTLDSYQNFLNRISANLGPVSKELSAKNTATTNSLSEFEIKREKNLDFVINNTPMREVLGKF